MNKQQSQGFIGQLVAEILSGVRDGLSKFSGLSRIAVIYQLDAGSELSICDPQDLLRGYETKIRATLFDEAMKPFKSAHNLQNQHYSEIDRDINQVELDGVISYGGQSGPVFYQMWFCDHNPEILSTGPIKRWLGHAALRFSHDVANGEELYTGISGWFLREFATHAVLDQIVLEHKRTLGLDSQFEIYSILSAILGIANIREESKSPHGKLVFIDPALIDSLDFMVRFDKLELPLLDNYKHVRKLLQAVHKLPNKLVSDGSNIIGIARGRIPQFHLTADFRGLFGFLKVNGQRICSFADGAYVAKTQQAKLFEIEEILYDFDLDSSVRASLFHIAASIVHYAQKENFGCSIVLDLSDPLTEIAGQNLEASLDLERSNLLELAFDLARVDGSLQVCRDRHLHRFGCLLDGPSIKTEDLSRGARYNSALRFTARNLQTIIIVVSSDRPVSVICNGLEYSSSYAHFSGRNKKLKPLPLVQWLEG